MGTFSEYIAPARERHEAGRQAVNSGDYTGILDMLLAYPELAARAASGGIGELSGLVGQSPTMQRKLANDVMGMMESTAGMGMSMRMVPKAPARRSFSTVIIDDGRPTQHVVHKSGMDFQYADAPARWPANDPNYATRITGQQQIDDIVQSGLVRSKPPGAKAKGGRTGVTHWSQGRESLVYDWGGNPNSYIIKAPSKNLDGRSGGIPIDELEGIYVYRDGQPTNILDDIRRSNASISRRMMESQ